MPKKSHLLITGIRRPGASTYRFRIYGNPESQFPPADLETTLAGLCRWIGHGDRPRDELAIRRSGAAILPVSG